MNAGRWTGAEDEWNEMTRSYEVGHGAPDRGTGYYDGGSYDAPAHDLPGYGQQTYDTLPRGVGVHDALTYGVQFRMADPGLGAAEEETYGASWEFEEGLARLLRTAAPEPSAPPAIPRQRVAHRRRPGRPARVAHALRRLARGPVPWLKVISLLIAAVTAAIVAMVGALGGAISYDPLRELAVPGVVGELAGWWPLLVYGPWLVASLSILRAAVHRRRAVHSWVVVVFFSVVAVYLCVAHSDRTTVGIAVSGLPPIAALVCFQQLVRQVTLTSPPRTGPRQPRHTVRRG